MQPIVRLNDFSLIWKRYREEYIGVLDRVGASGWWILGQEVTHFEKELAQFWGASHSVGCANGLDAIELLLRALGLKPGETVLTTPLSAFATSLAVVRAGGVPAFVDVDATGALRLDLARSYLRAHPEVRFFVPVHLYGHPMDPRELAALGKELNVTILEDCAQAIGASFEGRKVGSAQGIAATSFYPTKNLGAIGDGGAMIVQDAALAKKVAALRDYGQTQKYQHDVLGANSRLDELQAGFLRFALSCLPEWTASRKRIADRYLTGIKNPRLSPVRPAPGAESVWHLFPLLVEGDREQFRSHLEKAGIQTAIHYPTLIPEQPAAEPKWKSVEPLTMARMFAAKEVSLPLHPFLSETEIQRVIDACNAVE